jgi:hypothetical protein
VGGGAGGRVERDGGDVSSFHGEVRAFVGAFRRHGVATWSDVKRIRERRSAWLELAVDEDARAGRRLDAHAADLLSA